MLTLVDNYEIILGIGEPNTQPKACYFGVFSLS